MNPIPVVNGETKKRGRSKSDCMNLGPKENKLKVTPSVPALSELSDAQVRELAEKRNLIWSASRAVLEARYNDYLKESVNGRSQVKLLFESQLPWTAGIFRPVSDDPKEQLAEFHAFCVDFIEARKLRVRWTPADELVTVKDLLDLPEDTTDESDGEEKQETKPEVKSKKSK